MYEHLPTFVSDPDPSIYLGWNYVCADFETSNREHGSALDPQNNLGLACWRVGPAHKRYRKGSGSSFAVWADEFGQDELVQDIESADFLVCHNTKFELQWLRRCGMNLRKILPYCSMIAEKVIHSNRKVELSLDASAARYGLGNKLKTVSRLIKAGVNYTDIPGHMLEAYCHQDVALCEKIFLKQRGILATEGLLRVAYCRNLTTPVLADIEFNGMRLDTERVTEAYEDYAGRYKALETDFLVATGGINVKSPKQMGEHIYGSLGFAELADYKGRILKTATGAPKTDKETIARLDAKTPEQKAFKKIAVELVKLKVPVQNLTKMLKTCQKNPEMPIIYANFNQCVTDTGRLSSTGRNKGAQFQNVERAFKRLFCSRNPSSVICEGDGCQLEFRTAVHLGDDEVGRRDVSSGVDVHGATAAVIGCDRQTAKAFTFKPLFGGGSGTKAQKRYFAYFKDRYNGVARTQGRWAMEAASTKRTVTPWGLRFFWPKAEVQQSGYVTGQTQIYNAPIQSLATADIIPLVLVMLWHSVEDLGDTCLIVNTVHDSIVAEVEPQVLDRYTDHMVRCFTVDIYEMLEKLYGMKFSVMLGCEVKSATHWGEGKGTKTEANSSLFA